MSEEVDEGAHYRFGIEVVITERDLSKGFISINLDPFRIADVYNINDFAIQTILKKTLVAGNRGYKDIEQDLKDIICAAKRKLEMIREDEEVFIVKNKS